MARLINDSGVLGDAIKVTNKTVADVPFDKVIEAINVIQTRMGITGTTADEAGRTIAGSVGAMKSAWTNLITGLADENADIGKLVDNLVTTIFGDGTESNLGVLGNIMPAVKRALNGASKLVSELLPKIIKEIPSIINENLPVLAKAAIGLIKGLAKGIKDNAKTVLKTAMETIKFLTKNISDLLPELAQMSLEIIKAIAECLVQDEVLDNLIEAAVDIIVSICDFIAENIDMLFEIEVEIITSLVDYLLKPETLMRLTVAGGKIIASLGESLVSAMGSFNQYMAEIIAYIVETFAGIDLGEAGVNVIKTFLDGLTRGLMGAGLAKSAIAGQLPGIIDGSHQSGLDYVPYDGYIAELHKGEKVLTASQARNYDSASYGDINITVYGANYGDEQSLASAIALEIQNMTDRRAAVYA